MEYLKYVRHCAKKEIWWFPLKLVHSWEREERDEKKEEIRKKGEMDSKIRRKNRGREKQGGRKHENSGGTTEWSSNTMNQNFM